MSTGRARTPRTPLLLVLLALLVLIVLAAAAMTAPRTLRRSATAAQGMQSMPGMPGMPSSESAAADSAMSHEHMAMGPHMKMTAPRPRSAADDRRAAAIVATLRGAISRYRDYRVAVADRFIEFAPRIRQPMYHFTNYRHAFEANRRFDPARPTSLLYEAASGGGFQLIGAMYTAPRGFDEDELDRRVPLSVAAWHQHVNICLPRLLQLRTADWKRFGIAGSIATAGDCAASGGVFHPVVLGWMVHVYPFEADPARIWAQ